MKRSRKGKWEGRKGNPSKQTRLKKERSKEIKKNKIN